jgi:hypothetical protein
MSLTDTESPRALRPAAAAAWLLAVACAGCAGSSSPGPFDDWRTLRLEARSVALLSGTVEMRLQREADRALLTTHTTASLLGARLAAATTITELDPVSGRPESYQMTSRRRGRRYSFDASGYTVEKLKPGADPDAPLELWELRSHRRFEYPLDEAGAPQSVFDYYGMLLHLRELPLSRPGDEATLWVATSDGPLSFRIIVAEERRARRSYETLPDAEQRTVELRELRLRVVPADPERADEGFLDMAGETELWVEAESKTLLSLSGRVGKVPGTVTLELVALG